MKFLLPIAVAANLLSCVWQFFVVRNVVGPRLYQNGYKKGRTDADNWWIGVEASASEERQRIWREGR
jgi:hypothetical protein